jgi:hypothetical protein
VAHLSFDQCRRQIRHELFLKRHEDNNHTEIRLFNDAKKLDSALIYAGYELAYSTEWSRKRNVSHLEADISDLNFKIILESRYGQ